MRQQPFYDLAKTSRDPCFWRREQALIMKEIYSKLSRKTPVCPHSALDFDHMRKNEYFSDASWVSKRLGLHPIMEARENYNI